MGWSDEQKLKYANLLTAEQRSGLQRLTQEILPNIGKGIEGYQGPIAPDATAGQQQAFDYANRGTTDRTSRDAMTEEAILKLLSGDPAFDVDPQARRELYDAEKAEAMRTFERETLPMLARAYGAKGAARSGGLERAMRLGATDLGTNLYRRNTELLYADENARRGELTAARDRMATGVSADAQARGGQWNDLLGQIGVGNAERGVQGQQNEEAYNKWLAQQPYYNPWLGYLPLALGTQAIGPYIKNVEGTASKIGTGLSLGGSIVGAAGSAMGSSRDWKENGEPVNAAEVLTKLEQLPVESWRYKAGISDGGARRHIGTYAEDFTNAFGGDGRTLDLVDVMGVLMASVQALSARVRELEGGPPTVKPIHLERRTLAAQRAYLEAKRPELGDDTTNLLLETVAADEVGL